MKAKGCLLVGGFLLVVAVIGVVGFLLFLKYSLSHEEDQSYLTQRVTAKVLDTRSLDQDYGLIYSYQVGGKTYYDTATINRRGWLPGQSELDVCVDPHNPIRHAVEHGTGACGSPSLYSGTSDAKTTRPSW